MGEDTIVRRVVESLKGAQTKTISVVDIAKVVGVILSIVTASVTVYTAIQLNASEIKHLQKEVAEIKETNKLQWERITSLMTHKQ